MKTLRKFGLNFKGGEGYKQVVLSDSDFDAWSEKRGYKTDSSFVYPKGFSGAMVQFKREESHFTGVYYTLTLFKCDF